MRSLAPARTSSWWAVIMACSSVGGPSRLPYSGRVRFNPKADISGGHVTDVRGGGRGGGMGNIPMGAISGGGIGTTIVVIIIYVIVQFAGGGGGSGLGSAGAAAGAHPHHQRPPGAGAHPQPGPRARGGEGGLEDN